MVHGVGKKTNNIVEAIEQSYASDVTDEFVQPIIQVDAANNPMATISENDIVLCFNFRTDRGREISMALTQETFHEQNMAPINVSYYTMTAVRQDVQRCQRHISATTI